jgi:predicted metal-dependent phosphoesterase TrpH
MRETQEAFVDLHAHTTASDGSATPGELVEAARAAGLSAVAVTDHDSVDGVDLAREVAQGGDGLRVIAGVELSAFEEELEVHVLGLHLADPAKVEATLRDLQAARRVRGEAIVGVLNALGIPVTFDAVLHESGEGAVGRPHVARALIAGGWVSDQREAFDRYLGTGRPAHVPKARVSVESAAAIIHEAGGVAVYAHPGREGTLERLTALAARGLDGVEVRHPGHSADDVARLATLATHLGLLPSGGSDWHGAREGSRVLGAMRIPAEWSDRLEGRAERYRSVVAA